MPKSTLCVVDGCSRPVRTRDWCNRHYLRLRRHGDPLAGRPPWDEFEIPVEKTCTRCGETKPLEQFATRSGARDGHSPWCKACFKDHYRKTADAAGVRRREWIHANPNYFKDYYRANRAKKIAAARQYAVAHAEERREWMRRYAAENREKINAASREYQRRTGHKYSKARMLAKRTRVVETVDRREVFTRGAGRCGICAEPVDLATFHIDHIIPLARGGEHSYANTQPAHPLCNLQKGAREAA